MYVEDEVEDYEEYEDEDFETPDKNVLTKKRHPTEAMESILRPVKKQTPEVFIYNYNVKKFNIVVNAAFDYTANVATFNINCKHFADIDNFCLEFLVVNTSSNFLMVDTPPIEQITFSSNGFAFETITDYNIIRQCLIDLNQIENEFDNVDKCLIYPKNVSHYSTFLSNKKKVMSIEGGKFSNIGNDSKLFKTNITSILFGKNKNKILENLMEYNGKSLFPMFLLGAFQVKIELAKNYIFVPFIYSDSEEIEKEKQKEILMNTLSAYDLLKKYSTDIKSDEGVYNLAVECLNNDCFYKFLSESGVIPVPKDKDGYSNSRVQVEDECLRMLKEDREKFIDLIKITAGFNNLNSGDWYKYI